MQLAVIATSTPVSLANRNFSLRRFVASLFALPEAVDLAGEIGLIHARLIALRGSAPTWHPLHLKRVLARTVVEPLRQLRATADKSTRLQIDVALRALAEIDTGNSATFAIEDAAFVLRSAVQ